MGSRDRSAPDTCVFCSKSSATSGLLTDELSVMDSTQSGNLTCDLLEGEVKVMFILRKLLNLSELFCQEMLVTFGNPSGWLGVCKDCYNAVKETIYIERKIRQLEKSFEVLKKSLRRKIHNSEDCEVDDATVRIRMAVVTKEGTRGDISTGPIIVKTEREDEDNNIQYEDDFGDGGSLSDPDFYPETEDRTAKTQCEGVSDDEDWFQASKKIVKRSPRGRSRPRAGRSRKQMKTDDKDKVETCNTGDPVTAGEGSDLLYKCKRCSFTNTRNFNLLRHIRLVHGETTPDMLRAKYKGRCELCGILCKTLADLNRHKIEQHQLVQCPQCVRVCAPSRLNSHIKRYHSGSDTEQDGTKFPDIEKEGTSKDAEVFERNSSVEPETGVKDNGANGGVCKRIKPMKNSKAEVNDNGGLFQCHCCKYRSTTSTNLNRHIRSVHGEIPPSLTKVDPNVYMRCSQCDSVFETIDALKKHCVSKHKMVSCESCSQVFSKKSQLLAHEKRHHNENMLKRKTFKCPYCTFSSQLNSSLRRHLASIHMKSKKCSSCNEVFKNMNALRKHFKKNHRMVQCSKCPRLFMDARGLYYHENKYHRDSEVEKDINKTANVPRSRKIKCPHCNYYNTTQRGISYHLKTVHWELAVTRKSHSFRRKSLSFVCEKCAQEFQSVEELSKHKVDTHGMVQCGKCSKVLPALGFLELHEKKYHSAESAAKLAEWKESSRTQESMATSLENPEITTQSSQQIQVPHTPFPQDKHKIRRCRLCPETFLNPSALIKHQIDNHAEELFKCETCFEVFNSVLRLYQHKVAVHNEPDNPYRCSQPQCTYTNKRYTEIERHKRVVHKKRTRLICEICSASYSTEKYLLFHKIRDHGHKEDPKYNLHCKYCARTFSTPYYLADHVKCVHMGQHRYKCEYCGIGCRGKKQVQLHINRVHLKLRPIQCPEEGCEKRFGCKSEVKTHVSSVHRKIRNYKCSFCGKAFDNGHHLRRHEQIHTNADTKPYQCQICGKAYALMAYLRLHFRIHKKRGEMVDTASSVVQSSNAFNMAMASDSEGVAGLSIDDLGTSASLES